MAGFAFNFCVRYSAADARRETFDVVVIDDTCRANDVDGSMNATRRIFNEIGVLCGANDSIG